MRKSLPVILQTEEDQICSSTWRQVKPIAEIQWNLHKFVYNIELSGIYWTVWVELELPTEPMTEEQEAEFHECLANEIYPELDVVIGPRAFGTAAPLSVWWPFAGRPLELTTDDGEVWDQHRQYLNNVELEVHRFVRNQVALYHAIAGALDPE